MIKSWEEYGQGTEEDFRHNKHKFWKVVEEREEGMWQKGVKNVRNMNNKDGTLVLN